MYKVKCDDYGRTYINHAKRYVTIGMSKQGINPMTIDKHAIEKLILFINATIKY